ncbi:type VII secretion protein EccE [Mycobacterium sp. 1274756.6]|nr:type VII secretion protein EccE [Mycobacterium sp. 1274756.6]
MAPMKAQSPVGLALAWVRLLTVFLIAVGVLAVVSNWPHAWRPDIAWWSGIGVAAVVAVLALVTFRGVPLATLIGRWFGNFFRDKESALTAGRAAAIDHRHRFGHATVGVREHDGMLVAAVAVGAPVEGAATELPVQAIAGGLRQFDVRLDGIDIISVNSAANPEPVNGAEQRPSTWLVLRMDPQQNVDAVTVRDSVAAMVAAAAERIAEDLGRRRFDAFPLTAAELADLDTAVLAGVQPAGVVPRLRFLKRYDGSSAAAGHADGKHSGAKRADRKHADGRHADGKHAGARRSRSRRAEPAVRDRKHPDGYATSLWVSPKDLDTETLEQVWEVDADATVLTVRLVPRHYQVEVSAWVRYHTADRLTKEQRRGLNHLIGRQVRAVAAALPVPTLRSPLSVPARALTDDDALTLPLRHREEVSA